MLKESVGDNNVVPINFGTNDIMPAMPLLPFTSSSTIDSCRRLGDHHSMNTLFIASYPKSGTTWMQAVVYAILSEGNIDFGHISEFSPFFEIDKTWEVDRRDSPVESELEYKDIAKRYQKNHETLGWRVFNTHLRWDMMPKGGRMKYIYVIRNGKDVVLSFFHHLSHQEEGFSGSFDEFLDEWCEGNIAFGSWIDHLRSWIVAVYSNENVLLVKYEKMKEDLTQVITSVVWFLQIEGLTTELCHAISESLQFDKMRENKVKYQPISVTWTGGFNFLRKGVVGDSAEFFEGRHHDRFDRMIATAFPDGLPTWFERLNVL